MNQTFFPPHPKWRGELASNFELLINSRTMEGHAAKIELGDLLTWVQENFGGEEDGVNIYNSNGTLTSNRTLTGSSYTLNFTGIRHFNIASDSNDAAYFRFSAYNTANTANSLIDISPLTGISEYYTDTLVESRLTLNSSNSDFYFQDQLTGYISRFNASTTTTTIQTNPDGTLNILTPNVQNSTATANQVLTLIDAVTGTSEFSTLSDVSIYSTDGSLAGTRIANLNGFDLSFYDTSTTVSSGQAIRIHNHRFRALANDIQIGYYQAASGAAKTGLLQFFPLDNTNGGASSASLSKEAGAGSRMLLKNVDGVLELQAAATAADNKIILRQDGEVEFNMYGLGTFIDAAPAYLTGFTVDGTIVEVAVPGAGLVNDFLDLSDTPANYTSAGNKLVGVNSGANALEYKLIYGDTTGNLALGAAVDTSTWLLTGAAASGKSNIRLQAGTSPSSPMDGDLWVSSSNNVLNFNNKSTVGQVPLAIYTQTADKNINTSAAETTLLSSAPSVGAGFLTAGKTIRVTLSGYITNTGTPTMRIRVKLNSSTCIDTTAVTMTTITGTMMWSYTGLVTIRTTGVGGTAYGNGGSFEYYVATSSMRTLGSPSTATAAVDTTVSQTIDVTATWGTSSASNSITCTNALIEILG